VPKIIKVLAVDRAIVIMKRMSFLDVNIDVTKIIFHGYPEKKTLCLNSIGPQHCACLMFLCHTALSLGVEFQGLNINASEFLDSDYKCVMLLES